MYFKNHPPQKSPKTLLFLDAGTALDHIEKKRFVLHFKAGQFWC